MKVVYVAGPFRGPNAWVVEQNVRRAERLALKVWEAGAACICPHTNTRFYQGVGPDQKWLDGDIAILSRCDAILMTARWKQSEGARAEHEWANAHDIPVLYSIKELIAWLKK